MISAVNTLAEVRKYADIRLYIRRAIGVSRMEVNNDIYSSIFKEIFYDTFPLILYPLFPI